MGLGWDDFKRLLADAPLPAAVVDLDAMTRNAALLAGRLRDGTTLRVASKSVRHTGLLRRILEAGGPRFRGLMCYAVDEACFLLDAGFDDCLVAYPTVQGRALGALAQRVAAGRTAHVVVDAPAHVDALARAGVAAGTELSAIIEVDVAWRPLPGVHVGARRSPIRDAAAALAMARRIRDTAGVRLGGIMAYEAHVAGVQDATPFAPAMNLPKRWMKSRALPAAAALRADVVAALRADGHDVGLVNGGGTGSVDATSAEAVITEVAAGSGFLCPHLFSYYQGLPLEPAAFFALEACRTSDPGLVTCAGGGFVASGEPGWDKVPLPWLPAGLRYLAMEAAGEVQTPLTVPTGTEIAVGDPVIFRHAKAGELAERFTEYLLVSAGVVVAREPTYRGEGRCFG